MLRLRVPAALMLAGLLMVQCKSAHSTLSVARMAGYTPAARDQILFLNFRITGTAGGGEEVTLASATAGEGKLKDLSRPVHFPYQIRAVPRYSSSAIEREMVFEHALFKSAEVSDPSGHLKHAEVRAGAGNILIRLQADSRLNQLELFSVSPDKGTIKIYTLDFK
ncbi:MAG: hypothetical protein ACO1N1_03010 [Dyadobacter fermentans]